MNEDELYFYDDMTENEEKACKYFEKLIRFLFPVSYIVKDKGYFYLKIPEKVCRKEYSISLKLGKNIEEVKNYILNEITFGVNFETKHWIYVDNLENKER